MTPLQLRSEPLTWRSKCSLEEKVNMKREVKTKVLLDNSNLIKRSEISYQQIHEGFFIQNWE